MTDKEEKNPLIRKGECPSCGNVIDIRKDKHGKAYYNCGGSYEDGTKCKRSVRLSVRQSRKLIEETTRQQAAKPAPKVAGAVEVDDTPLELQPSSPQTPAEPAKTDADGQKKPFWDLETGYE